MATQYRIIEEGPEAFYVEVGRPYLFFTRWMLLRDEHEASHSAYSYSPGAYVRYPTFEEAAEAIKYLQGAAVGHVVSPRILAYN
jgi:hypothetical protein